MKLYAELAHWWPLFSPPEEYTEEAAFFLEAFRNAGPPPVPRSVLELGSGAGSNAFHLKEHFALTLVDLSPEMLAVSRALNPQCEHIVGDMRSVRLGRQFDAVFVHDAIMYMVTEEDLRRAIETTSIHCKPGATALIVPDYVRESFQPCTDHGGHDGRQRSLRYMEWEFDPDPTDTTCQAHFAFLLREGEQVRVEHDEHIFGLFPRAVWLRLLSEAGFRTQVITDQYEREVFVAHKLGMDASG